MTRALRVKPALVLDIVSKVSIYRTFDVPGIEISKFRYIERVLPSDPPCYLCRYRTKASMYVKHQNRAHICRLAFLLIDIESKSILVRYLNTNLPTAHTEVPQRSSQRMSDEGRGGGIDLAQLRRCLSSLLFLVHKKTHRNVIVFRQLHTSGRLSRSSTGPDLSQERLYRICGVQIQSPGTCARRAEYTGPIRQHGLDHTTSGVEICLQISTSWKRRSMICQMICPRCGRLVP